MSGFLHTKFDDSTIDVKRPVNMQKGKID